MQASLQTTEIRKGSEKVGAPWVLLRREKGSRREKGKGKGVILVYSAAKLEFAEVYMQNIPAGREYQLA